MRKRLWSKLCGAALVAGMLGAATARGTEVSGTDTAYAATEIADAGMPGRNAVDAGMSGAETDTEITIAIPSKTGALHVEGTRLIGEDGGTVQLRGISTHGIAWYPQYVNESCFQELREEWNVNVVRLAMYTAESGGYCTDGDQAYLEDLVEQGVKAAAAADLYVIVDWHVLADCDPNVHKKEAKTFFAKMTERLSGYDHVLYEICNEPNGGTEWAAVKSYAEEVIPVIREHAPDAVILVGTPNWSQDVDQAAADPITGYDNLMYTLHYYAATHKEDLRSRMMSAIDAGLPVFVSEYGICDASGNGALDIDEANRWRETLDQYGVSYVAWNLSNKNESSAILSPACQKDGGFQWDDLTNSGKWLYETLTGSGAPDAGQGQNNNPPDAGQGQNNNPSDAGTGTQSVFTSGQLSCAATVKNSWEADGQTFYQYDLVLENTGEQCTHWSVDVPFNGAFALSDGWNGAYTVHEQTLHIEDAGYNGAVEPGGYVTDVGFIVSGASKDACAIKSR